MESVVIGVNIVRAWSTFDASVADYETGRLSVSIVDENGRPQCFNHRDMLDSTVQIDHGRHERVYRTRVLFIALPNFMCT